MSRNTAATEAIKRADRRTKIAIGICVLLQVALIVFCAWRYYSGNGIFYLCLILVNLGGAGLNIFNWLYYL